jgi:Molecular chaperone (small heat shock protein)
MLLAKRSQDLFPTLFNDLWDWNTGMQVSATPQMNIIENNDDYKLELSVPGLSKEDLNLLVDDDNNLVIEMLTKNQKEEKNQNRHYLRREFAVEQFRQSVALSDDIHKDKISAKVENGILEVTLPKMKPEEKKNVIKNIVIQ